MISSHFFKVFEYCLLPSIKSLPLCPSQFGYRSGASTVLANAILKETIERYFCAGSPVYSCFLDLSKAFERVNHEFFLQKLERKGCPFHTVNILRTIYTGILGSECMLVVPFPMSGAPVEVSGREELHQHIYLMCTLMIFCQIFPL